MIKLFTRTAIMLLALFIMQPLSSQTICLVGDAADVSGLPTAEQNAYNWALGLYGDNATYQSFADIAANGVPATCKSIWFHYEEDAALPAGAAGAATAIGDYVNGGGGLVVSSFATEYLVTIGATTTAPTETLDKDPAGPDVAWGVRPFTGMENHPVFNGMSLTTDWVDANWGGYRTVAADVAGREAIRWWNDGSFPGTPIAGMPWWDPNNTAIPVLGEMNVGSGKVMFASAPGYNWINSPINSAEAQGNLNRLTANMLNLVQPVDVEIVLAMDASSVADLPQGEKNAYEWALSHYGEAAAYASFSDIAANGVPATSKAIWIHLEEDQTLPASASDMIANATAFVNGGGRILLSGFATQAVPLLAPEAAAVTEIIDNDPAGPDAAWGVRPLTGQENHPFFNGLTETTDWADGNWGGFRTVADDVAGREAIAWWTGGAYPGTPIAGMPWWDPNNLDIPVIGTIDVGSGTIITATAPGFNWINAPINSAEAQGNLNQLTVNMLGAISSQPDIVLIGAAADIASLPESESNAYSWATSNMNATYMSFETLNQMGIPSSASTVWYHLEDAPEIPEAANMVAPLIGNFVNGGGKIVVSGFAAEYLVTIGATDVSTTETIDNDPAGPDAAWGVQPLVGKENHPFFDGLTLTTDWADPNWGGFRTISDSVAGHEVIRWWTGGAFPGNPIGAMPWWDENNPDIPILGTLDVGDGIAAFATGPGYQWLPAAMNGATEQANLEQLTANILNFTKPTTAATVLMIGDATDIAGLPQGEQNAYNWGANALGEDGTYMSFEEISNVGIPASTEVIWYHYEDTSALAGDFTLIAGAVNQFVRSGGGIVTSGFATQALETADLATAVSEVIDKDPAGPDAAWGVKPLAGKESHPIFAGLTETTDWADPNWGGFRTIGDTVVGREAMAWWTGGTYPGEPIGIMPWWASDNGDIPIIGEIIAGNGGAVTATAPGYHWINADINEATAQANLEQLTLNMLNYARLFNEVQAITVTGGNGGIIVEGEEDGQVISIAVSNAPFVDPINPENWTISGLPAGITATITRVDDGNATITLSGTAEDYDEDLSLEISIPASEFSNLRTDALTSTGDVIFRGFTEQENVAGKIALLGTEDNLADLDEDEIAAYQWALDAFPDEATYYSFEQLVLDPSLLDDVAVAWFHYDKFVELPLLADNPNTEAVLRGFVESGGGMLCTGAASQYVVNLGVETAGPNEVRKAEEPFLNPDPWGFGQKEPDHPIFVNLPNPFFTLFSETGLREDLLSWWVINPSDDRFADIPPEDRFHGKQLASTEWDAGFNVLVTVGEYEGTDGAGNVIAVGAGAYDWFTPGGTNDLRPNLELFTTNMLNYLKGTRSVSVVEVDNSVFELQTTPNPFNNTVNISFNLPEKSEVILEIFNLQGQKVANLFSGELAGGFHNQYWTPNGNADGMYIYTLQVGNQITYGKIMHQKH